MSCPGAVRTHDPDLSASESSASRRVPIQLLQMFLRSHVFYLAKMGLLMFRKRIASGRSSSWTTVMLWRWNRRVRRSMPY